MRARRCFSLYLFLSFLPTEISSSPEDKLHCGSNINGQITLSGLRSKMRIEPLLLPLPLFSVFIHCKWDYNAWLLLYHSYVTTKMADFNSKMSIFETWFLATKSLSAQMNSQWRQSKSETFDLGKLFQDHTFPWKAKPQHHFSWQHFFSLQFTLKFFPLGIVEIQWHYLPIPKLYLLYFISFSIMKQQFIT